MTTKTTGAKAGPFPLEVIPPLTPKGAYTILTAQGNHAGTTYDPQIARLLSAAQDLLEAAQLAYTALMDGTPDEADYNKRDARAALRAALSKAGA